MKIVAVFMVLTGLVIGAGAALEFAYLGPEHTQFWVAVFTTPAGLLFAGVGVLLWFRGAGIKRLVVLAGLVMATATVAATALGIMGPPATLTGLAGALVALGWAWKARPAPA
jgi:hypothetical protein